MPKPAIISFNANAKMEQWPDFPESEIASGSRAQRGHAWFEDKALGLSAGIWEAEANISHWMNYPVTEFMLVLEGEVVIVEETGETRIGSGESFIIPKGLRCRWTQPGKVKKFFVILDENSGAVSPGPLKVIKIDPKVKLQPSTPPSAGYFAFSGSNATCPRIFRGCDGPIHRRDLGYNRLPPQAPRLQPV